MQRALTKPNWFPKLLLVVGLIMCAAGGIMTFIIGKLTNYTVDIIGICIAVAGICIWSEKTLKESHKRWVSVSRKVEWVILLSLIVGGLIVYLVFKDGDKMGIIPYILIFIAMGIGLLFRLLFIKKHGFPPTLSDLYSSRVKSKDSTEEKVKISDIFGRPDIPAGRLYEKEEREIEQGKKHGEE